MMAALGQAVEIAERTWWVGHYLPGDAFQCHVYLIEHGDQSVLIDPGSALTFAHTLKKIETIIPFSHIRYFICHHQDPDITGALNLIDRMVARDDAVLITHWRAAALLKHYDLKRLPFWLVEEHDWELALGNRLLHFTLTPYMHFPGAFTTFDAATGVLFSSDIFGGFTEKWRLFAEDEAYFDDIRAFHEHYMPSRDIVQHGLREIEKWPIRLIAPQHGSIIREPLVRFMFRKLKGLDCGLYLMARGDTNVRRLMAINRMLRQALNAIMLYRDFRDIVHHLLPAVSEVLRVESLEFYAGQGENAVYLGPANRYRGEEVMPPPFFATAFAKPPGQEKLRYCRREPGGDRLLVPLAFEGNSVRALAVLTLKADADISPEVDEAIGQLCDPLMVAVEREVIYRGVERERDELYLRSIHDPLTGLYSRYYMHDAVERMLASHDRGVISGVALVMLDVDYFKCVNDTYGHSTGDAVLETLGRALLNACRRVDIPVRVGGEEFAAFIISRNKREGVQLAERLRSHFEQQRFVCEGREFKVTLSAGVANHLKGAEDIQDLIRRADKALYEAKESGRNCVCTAED